MPFFLTTALFVSTRSDCGELQTSWTSFGSAHPETSKAAAATSLGSDGRTEGGQTQAVVLFILHPCSRQRQIQTIVFPGVYSFGVGFLSIRPIYIL